MSKLRTNISQIQKYLRGELDERAMHDLEREAQHDPFLMEAMEGYELAGKNQQPHLDLLQQQLDARVNKTERRIMPWWTIAAAASTIGLLVVVGLIYNKNEQASNKPVVAAVAPTAAIQPGTDSVTVTQPPAPADKQSVVASAARPYSYGEGHRTTVAAQPQAPSAQVPVTADSTLLAMKEPGALPLDERVMDVIAKQKDSADMPSVVAVTKRPISQPLQAKVDGVQKQERQGKRESENSYYLGTMQLPQPKQELQGKPEIRQDREQLPGGNTGLAASKKASDARHNKDSLNNSMTLSMSATNGSAAGSLNELVVVTTTGAAAPKMGMAAYLNELQKLAVLPKGQKPGPVALKIKVLGNGTLTDISIQKSLSATADAKAKKLVTEGPAWSGNANGQPQEVTIALTFRTE